MVSDSHSIKYLLKDPLDLMPSSKLKTALHQIKSEQNFDLISATALIKPMTIEFYKNWIATSQHGEMAYLESHLPFKEDPTQLHQSLRSAITIAFNYFPAFKPYQLAIPARAALYAQNEDYHFWLKEKLSRSITTLKEHFPEDEFFPYVDSGPVLERDLSYRSGLGWFGKNTCIIHSQNGSLFFLAEILTSVEITDGSPIHEDLCKNCTKCIDICPTGALSGDKKLNANKCISYLTIESKKTPPVELRPKIGDWFFGCDMCQTVCPWNQKKLNLLELNDTRKSLQLVTTLQPHKEQELEEFLRTILESSNKKIQKMFYGTPLMRSGGFGLKRNAMIVIANRKISSLKPQVEKYLEDAKLAELASWVLKTI